MLGIQVTRDMSYLLIYGPLRLNGQNKCRCFARPGLGKAQNVFAGKDRWNRLRGTPPLLLRIRREESKMSENRVTV